MLERRRWAFGPPQRRQAESQAGLAVYELLDVMHLHPAEAAATKLASNVRGVQARRGRLPLHFTACFPYHRMHTSGLVQMRLPNCTDVATFQVLLQRNYFRVKEGLEPCRVLGNSRTRPDRTVLNICSHAGYSLLSFAVSALSAVRLVNVVK